MVQPIFAEIWNAIFETISAPDVEGFSIYFEDNQEQTPRNNCPFYKRSGCLTATARLPAPSPSFETALIPLRVCSSSWVRAPPGRDALEQLLQRLALQPMGSTKVARPAAVRTRVRASLGRGELLSVPSCHTCSEDVSSSQLGG